MDLKIFNKNRHQFIPIDAVYIGRPSKWGNPFSHLETNLAARVSSREEAIEKYEEWIHRPEQEWLRNDAKKELRGKDLICWCAPLDCHGRILMKIANE